MTLPDVVSREQWLEARRQFLARENRPDAARCRPPLDASEVDQICRGNAAEIFGIKV